jgi:hypothetical protein
VHELLDIRVARVIDGGYGPIPDDFALIEHGHAARDFAHRTHIMGDGDGGGAQFLHATDDQVIDGIRVDDVANAAETIGYEVLTRIGPRVKRLYV